MNTRSNTNTKSRNAALIGSAAPILAIVGFLVWRSDVPDLLPTHWNVSGEVNGTTGATAFFIGVLVIAVVLVALSVVLSTNRRDRGASRLLVAILTSSAWLVCGIYLMCLVLARHASTAQQVRLPWYALLPVLAVPFAVGALIWSMLPAPPTSLSTADTSSQIRIGAGERVVWISGAHSVALRVTSVALAVGAAAFALFEPWPAVVLAFAAVLVLFASELVVRIDDDGLHTLWGPVGLPRQVLHLDAMVDAGAQDIRPMQWGGWGFRITSRGTAATIRSGPGIVVRRTNGNSYVVTVDDADEGAGVLTALLQRAGDRSGETGAAHR